MKKIMFYHTTDEYGCFSNFSNHSIFVDGTTWPTVEHYFQASKFLDDRLMFQIQIANSPMEAAKLGRDKEKPLRVDWEAIKDNIMRQAIEAKVRQNEDVKEMLFSTGDALIVEHTSNDCYWGDGGDGRGKNMLGCILMEIREKLISEPDIPKVDMVPPWVKYPNEPRYSLGWAMGGLQTYIDKWGQWVETLSVEEQSSYTSKNPESNEWKGFYKEIGLECTHNN